MSTIERDRQDRAGRPTVWRWVGIGVSLLIFAAALFALQRLLSDVKMGEVLSAFTSIERSSLLAAVGFTALSYLTLTGYDAVALRHLGKRVPYGNTALASFTSYAFSNNIGLALLTGGSIRYRIYSMEGLTAVDIAALTGISTLTFFLGALSALGIALVLEPETLSVINRLPVTINQLLGGTMLVALAAYCIWVSLRSRAVNVRGFRLALPGAGLTLSQISIALADIVFASAALFVLMPNELAIDYTAFAGVFVAALTLGLLAHTPGGIGVFEAMILLALPDAPPDVILGRLILFRCVYYLLPLAVAAGLLALNEVLHPEGAGRRLGNTALAAGGSAAPQVVGLLVLAGGAILLLSGTPTPNQGRYSWIVSLEPVWLRELAHLIAGLAGVVLVLVSRGLFRRLTRAWRIAVVGLSVGAVAAILRGFDFEEAAALAFALLVLLATRRGFARHGRVRNLSYPAVWIAVFATVIGFSLWLGVLAYGQQGLDPYALARFGSMEDAARFMRTSVLVVLCATAFLAFVTLHVDDTPSARPLVPSAVRAIVRNADDPLARHAFAGDKRFLIDDEERAFLMYAVYRRTWLALGMPQGERESALSLIARFRDLAEAEGGDAVMIDIGEDDLADLREAGMLPAVLGERASLDLPLPSKLEPGMLLDDVRTNTVPAANAKAHVQEMRAIDAAWQAVRSVDARQFAHGVMPNDDTPRSDIVYLRRGGESVAFAMVWFGRKGTAVLDVMRAKPQQAAGDDQAILRSLIMATAEHAAARGAKRLHIGLLPGAAVAGDMLSPVLQSAGADFYSHGEHFRDADHLRRFMSAFGPQFETRYLVSAGGANLPVSIRDAAVIVTGRPLSRGLDLGVEPVRT